MQLLNKKILITGASGFIGLNLTKKIVELGVKPAVLIKDLKNVSAFSDMKDKIIIYETDITDRVNLNKIIKKINPEVVFHLAAYGVYTYTQTDLDNIKKMISTNIYGTINLLYALKDTQCKLFINTGSCFEYGSGIAPFKEKNPLSPCNIYGQTKVASTYIAHRLAKKFKIKINTIRPFTVYGPGSRNERFIPTVIKRCLANDDILIPKQKIIRDYIYIDDVVRAYLMLAENKEFKNDLIINVSTGKGVSLEEVIKKIKNLTHSKSIVKKGGYPIREGEVINLIGSNTLAKRYLNLKPSCSLEEGLKYSIAFLKRN